MKTARRLMRVEVGLLETKQHLRVLQIALNNPENGNALNIELCNELLEALDRAEGDRSVGAILLTANGSDFCAGMDLKEQLEADKVQLGGIHQRLFSTVQRIHKPIVAAVHGSVFAGGMGLAANAHIVVAHPETRFGLTELRVGYWPVFIYRAVEHAIGERRAMELSLTASDFEAEEAFRYGLVTEISSDPLHRAAEIAARMSAYSPSAIKIGLGYAHQIRGRDWDYAGEVGTKARSHLLATKDYSEGVRAAIEKRQPEWPSLHE
jgi:enoyl-CoA hydratase/carnithine racemase